MVFAAHEILRTNPNPSAEQIRHGLEGNMCRCTGYQNIVRAVQTAAAIRDARWRRPMSDHERAGTRVSDQASGGARIRGC